MTCISRLRIEMRTMILTTMLGVTTSNLLSKEQNMIIENKGVWLIKTKSKAGVTMGVERADLESLCMFKKISLSHHFWNKLTKINLKINKMKRITTNSTQVNYRKQTRLFTGAYNFATTATFQLSKKTKDTSKVEKDKQTI